VAILMFVLMLDPSRIVAPSTPPPLAWCAKVDDLKRIDFGPVRADASSSLDPPSLKIRELRPLDFDRL